MHFFSLTVFCFQIRGKLSVKVESSDGRKETIEVNSVQNSDDIHAVCTQQSTIYLLHSITILIKNSRVHHCLP